MLDPGVFSDFRWFQAVEAEKQRRFATEILRLELELFEFYARNPLDLAEVSFTEDSSRDEWFAARHSGIYSAFVAALCATSLAGCQRTVTGISEAELVGSYVTNRDVGTEYQMRLILDSDNTFLLTCLGDAARTQGRWTLVQQYMLHLEQNDAERSGKCARLLPNYTTLTRRHGVLSIGVDTNEGIELSRE